MKKDSPLILSIILGAALIAVGCAPKPATAPRPKGSLFIVGGGDRDEPLMQRYIELAEAHDTGRIVIFTMASSTPDEVGQELLEEFKLNGAKDVAYYNLQHEQASQPGSDKILNGAGGVWFSGGDQVLLTAALLNTPVHQRMLELYREGAVIGGTSAGAAVQSEFMITGNERKAGGTEGDWEVILADDVEHAEGFGFVRNAVIDQHFVARRRHNRLIAVVLQNPKLVGVGVDEATALLVRPDGKYEALGASQVIVYDARQARVSQSPDGRLGGHDLTMHALLAGDVYDIATGRVEEQGK